MIEIVCVIYFEIWRVILRVLYKEVVWLFCGKGVWSGVWGVWGGVYKGVCGGNFLILILNF